MNCTEFEAALASSVETRQPLTTTAREHVTVCTECRIDFDVQQQLNAVIDVWRPVAPPLLLVSAVLSELAMQSAAGIPSVAIAAERPTSRRIQSGRLAIASVATCLVLALVIGSRQTGRNPADLAQVRLPQRADRISADEPLDVAETLTAVFSGLRSEYREMANDTTGVARELANALPQHVTIPAIPVRDEFERPRVAGNVARMWSPIGSRVENALGFLWQAVPGDVPSG